VDSKPKSDPSGSSDNKPLDFQSVLAAERKAGMPPQGKAVGLAFSGGGIRSATFNLGVIQALAELNLLRRFDYLSTISGGGYIGSWLSLFIRRYAGGDVADAEAALASRDERGLEHRAIRFLRAFSNYLTPKIGLSRDTLVALATYLRNLLLNLTILVTLLGGLLLVPRIAALAGGQLRDWAGFDGWYDTITVVLLIAPTSIAALCLLHRPSARGVHRPWFMRSRTLLVLIDVPVLAAAFVATAFYLRAVANQSISAGAWFGSVMIAYVLLWFLGLLIATGLLPEARTHAKQLVSRERARWHGAFVLLAVTAGATGAALLLAVAKAIGAVPEPHRFWVGVTFGPPAVIGAIMLMIVAHIGIMGRKFGEPDRELWSVFGARLLRLALCWVLFFVIALYGAAAIRWTNEWIVGLGGIAWVASTLFGVFAGKSKATGKKDTHRGTELFTNLAPYVFVLGLLMVLSWGVHRTLEWADVQRGGLPSTTAENHSPDALNGISPRAETTPGTPVVTVEDIERPGLWHQFRAIAHEEYASIERWFKPAWAIPVTALTAFVATLLLSWRVNINLFSLHHFYRNRLTRCYLGATNPERKPHALTGFDPADDEPLATLAKPDGSQVQRPLHIVGTAINLNRGRQLAWQSRRAASFAFTPLHAGYEPASAQVSGGYRPVGEYGKDADGQPMMLGTTVAISGAVKRHPVSRDKATAIFTHPGRRLRVRVVGCRGSLRGL
jgi:hypothetical protein